MGYASGKVYGGELWNTLYMEAVLKQLRAEGMEVLSADVARISPLVHKHINF
jgi:hypothetical protein